VLIPYRFLIPLLVFTLLIGVVIGDRLSAESPWDDDDDGRSGGCSGIASARLHACAHRFGSWDSRRPERDSGRSGGGPPGWSRRNSDWACGNDRGGREDD
jgi:hypothetical protein